MSAASPPTAKEIRDLYEMLLGRIIEVSSNYEILKPDEESGYCVVFFNGAMRTICTACIMDLGLCAYTGATSQLIPAAEAQDCINNGYLDDSCIEDVYEVSNVFSFLFNKEGTPHVSTGLIYTPGEELPANEHKMVTSYMKRHGSTLDTEGYGKGRLRVMCFN